MKKAALSFVALVLCLALLASCSAGTSGSVVDGSSNTSSYLPPWMRPDFDTSKSSSKPAPNYSSSANSNYTNSNNTQINSTTMSTTPADGNAPAGATKYSGTRDPWLWPFAATSIWNMPIGSGAKLQKANFKSEYCIATDDEYLVKVPAGSPIVDVYSPSSWNARWPGANKVGTLQIPADFYLADASGNSTPNNCAAFLMPDGRTIRQLEPCCRLETGNARIVGWLHSEDQDIYGAGIKGTHYGSGLSAIGGSIRKGELTSNEPIKHALKLNVYAKNYLYYDRGTNKGYIWPSDRHDSYAASGNNAYGGTNPNLRMGTLLTIPKSMTAESLGIKTEVGKKLLYALQNYGCYIVDDSAWSCYAWSTEAGVSDEVNAKYGFSLVSNSNWNNDYYKDSMALITNLHIVTNNSPTSIGGGGTPCKPLAPDFK